MLHNESNEITVVKESAKNHPGVDSTKTLAIHRAKQGIWELLRKNAGVFQRKIVENRGYFQMKEQMLSYLLHQLKVKIETGNTSKF